MYSRMESRLERMSRSLEQRTSTDRQEKGKGMSLTTPRALHNNNASLCVKGALQNIRKGLSQFQPSYRD